MSAECGRDHTCGADAAAANEAFDDPVDVDRVVDGLPDALVGQRTARRVDTYVHQLERGRRHEHRLTTLVVHPFTGFDGGNLQEIDIATFVFGDGRARLGDYARAERVGFRRPPEVRRISGEQQEIVVLPCDEL